jgi:hypothetical protein
MRAGKCISCLTPRTCDLNLGKPNGVSCAAHGVKLQDPQDPRKR